MENKKKKEKNVVSERELFYVAVGTGFFLFIAFSGYLEFLLLAILVLGGAFLIYGKDIFAYLEKEQKKQEVKKKDDVTKIYEWIGYSILLPAMMTLAELIKVKSNLEVEEIYVKKMKMNQRTGDLLFLYKIPKKELSEHDSKMLYNLIRTQVLKEIQSGDFFLIPEVTEKVMNLDVVKVQEYPESISIFIVLRNKPQAPNLEVFEDDQF